ncbi:MAG: M48 family metallopeptidase [Bernardetiaceae bacterium]|nr:M48 family metallopeptidase [Bernardetiaceae bacterium]
MESYLFHIIVFALIASTVWDIFLNWLNLRHTAIVPPAPLTSIYEAQGYAKSVRYLRADTNLSFLSNTFNLALLLGLLFSGAFVSLDTYLHSYIQHPVLHALSFFLIIGTLNELIFLPFCYYKTFHIEQAFGFNTMSLMQFFQNKIKAYVLMMLIAFLIGYILLYIVLMIGPNFWYYSWAIIMGFIFFTQWAYLRFILPLFNRLSPLKDGSLRQAIEDYVTKLDFDVAEILVVNGSAQSTKANAFFMGLGKRKRIVLYDTLLETLKEQEIVAVVAHELGHYKKRHVEWGLFKAFLRTGLMQFLLATAIFSPALSTSLGSPAMSLPLNILGFFFLYQLLSLLLDGIEYAIMRRQELEADAYAAQTYCPKKLASSLKKLAVHNLTNLSPHPLFVAFNHNHPPLLKRLEALSKLK